MNDWEKQFDKQFRHTEINWEGSPYESRYTTWKAENLDDLSPKDIKNFIRQQKELSRREGIEEAINEAKKHFTTIHCSACTDGQCYGLQACTWNKLSSLRSKLLPKDE